MDVGVMIEERPGQGKEEGGQGGLSEWGGGQGQGLPRLGGAVVPRGVMLLYLSVCT